MTAVAPCGHLPAGAPDGFKPCHLPWTHIIVTPKRPGTGHRNPDDFIWDLELPSRWAWP